MLHSNPQPCEFTIKKVDNNYIYLLIHHPHPAIKKITFAAAHGTPRFDKTLRFSLIISFNENTGDQIDRFKEQLQLNIQKKQDEIKKSGDLGKDIDVDTDIELVVHDTEIKEDDTSKFVKISDEIRKNSLNTNIKIIPTTESIMQTGRHIKVMGAPSVVVPAGIAACFPSIRDFGSEIIALLGKIERQYVRRAMWSTHDDKDKNKKDSRLDVLQDQLRPDLNRLFKSYSSPFASQKKPQAAGTKQQATPDNSNNSPIITPQSAVNQTTTNANDPKQTQAAGANQQATPNTVSGNPTITPQTTVHKTTTKAKDLNHPQAAGNNLQTTANTSNNNLIVTPQCDFTVKKVDDSLLYLCMHNPYPAIKEITFVVAQSETRRDPGLSFSLIISFNENTDDYIDRYKKQLQLNIQKLEEYNTSVGAAAYDTDISFALHDPETKADNMSSFVRVSDDVRNNSTKTIPSTKSIMQTGGHIKIIGMAPEVFRVAIAACNPDRDLDSKITSFLKNMNKNLSRNGDWTRYKDKDKDKENKYLARVKKWLSPQLIPFFTPHSSSLTPQKQPQVAGASHQAIPNTVNNNEPVITPHQSQGKDQDKNTPSGNAVESRLRKHKLARFIDRLGFLKEIEALMADKTKQDIPNNLSFREALEALVDDLNKDFLRQEDALEKQAQKTGKNPDYSTLEQTTAGKIAARTLAMLQALKKETAAAAKLDIIRCYENDCKATPGWLKFAKGLAMVCFAAVGFVMGAVIGMGIGIAVGAWSGPGAFVTAALGAVQGAAIGVMAAASLVGLGAAIVSGLVLFKAQPSVSKATELARVSENLLSPTI